MLSVFILIPLSLFYWGGWFLWAVILRMTGGQHPDVPEAPPLNRSRWWLAAFALLMLVLTVTPSPFPGENGSGSGLLQQLDEWRHQASQPSQQR
jgi:hypothetical protein